MAILIAHSSADSFLANWVYDKFRNDFGIECNILEIDKELAVKRGNSSLVPFLSEKLNECDTLMVVVSKSSKEAWWVPFLIGTAREMHKVITIYTGLFEPAQIPNKMNLPEYLLEWPRLREASDLETFVDEFNGKAYAMKNGGVDRYGVAKYNNTDFDARTFEITVMMVLGQKSFI